MTDDFLDDYSRYLAGELTYEELHARDRRRRLDKAQRDVLAIEANRRVLEALSKR